MLTRSLEYIFLKIFSSYYFATLLTSLAFRCSFSLPQLEYNCVVRRFTLQDFKKISTVL